MFAGSGELPVANSKQWSQIVDDHSYANKLETLGVLPQFLNQLYIPCRNRREAIATTRVTGKI